MNKIERVPKSIKYVLTLEMTAKERLALHVLVGSGIVGSMANPIRKLTDKIYNILEEDEESGSSSYYSMAKTITPARVI